MPDSVEPQANQTKPTISTSSGGVELDAEHISIGGSVAGRDLIEQKTTNVTNVGLSPQAVQKLLITVGALVFLTAACFFASGIFIGTRIATAINQKVDSNIAAGEEFKQYLADLAKLPDGSPVDLAFNVNQLSSYVRHFLGPEIGLDNGRVRVLENGEFVFYGSWSGTGHRPIAVVATINPNGGPLFKLERASVQVISFPTGDPDTVSPFLWLPISNAAVQPLVDAINARIGANLQATAQPQVAVPGEGGNDLTGGQVQLSGDAK